ncbi:MAG: serine/threonine protein phosphatase, partial [Armatimonadota bacterium]|nr:serine/threonine protein phosphatase [Armatimonadota bacterium]
RTLAIGDIHGCSRAFDLLIAAVQLQPDDRIIALGDYVDRGPDSKGVLDRLIALHATGRLVALRGNHEIMMLLARVDVSSARFWLKFGGDTTLASYATSGQPKTLRDVPRSHWEFIENVCVNYYETDMHIFVHAGLNPDLALSDQPESVLFWERFADVGPHFSGKTVICGHTSQKSGRPINLGYAICIDTCVYGQGWLTCLDVTSGKVWQTNQAGQQRTAWIHDFLVSDY